jgi:tetratricopeptide (TPR) repeat protein
VLGRQIGAGGMGVVYEARDPELHRRVAVKLLHGGLRGDAATVRAHLLREARAMAQLAHPNVVMVHDVGQVGDRVFLAMELVEGSTLREWLATRPSAEAIIDVFVQAGAGLVAAHKIGLVHRDFKPDNVLIADGRARVTDFGLARPLELSADAGPSPAAAALDVSLAATRPGALVGTPAYMSPEQLRGHTADARSDQFSFCIALFEAFHRRRPFAGGSFAELARNVLEGRRLPIASGTPRSVARVLKRGLHPLPHRRYASMAELLAELQHPRARAITPMLGLAAAGAGAAIVTGGLLLWTPADDPPTAEAPTRVVPAEGPSSLCDADGIGDAWTPARRAVVVEQLQQRLLGKDAPPATATALDAWAQRWTAALRSACTSPSAPALACLDSTRDRFAALATELGDAGSIEAEHALKAATDLTSPERCTDDARTQRHPAPPADAKLAARVRLARREVATVRAKIDLASEDAVDAANAALTTADATEHAPVRAEARLALGLALRRAGEVDAAAQVLDAAIVDAAEATHPDVTTEAALALVEIVGAGLMRTADTQKWIRIVQAEIDAFDDQELAAALVLHRVEIARAVAEWRDAREAATEALELWSGDPEALLATSRALLGGEEAKAALEHASVAIERGEARWPKRDFRLARLHAAKGHALLALGKPADALAAFESSDKLRIYPREYDEDIDAMRADVGRAIALAELGRTAEADKAFADARSDGPQWLENAEIMGLHAQWLVAHARPQEAVTTIAEALAYLEPRVGADDPRLVTTLRRMGAIETAAGNFAAADEALERAGSILEQSVEYGPLWGLVHETRADLRARQGDREAQLAELDDAFLTIHSGYGSTARRTRENVLRRADLAWDLGQHDYARGLYGTSVEYVTQRYGPDHPDTLRVTARAGG